MRNFAKGEIVVDYHAIPISKAESKLMMHAPANDRRSDYLFSLPGGIFLDGSSEFCTCHPQTRLIGRLLNFSHKNDPTCNIRPQYFEFRHNHMKTFKTVLFVASRDILILEELTFDYNDAEGCSDFL